MGYNMPIKSVFNMWAKKQKKPYNVVGPETPDA